MANTQPFGAPTKLFDLGHSRVPYYRVGRGPDLFFLHGWPLYSATFREIVPKLADRFTCHLIDLPGAGDSEWSRESKISLLDHTASARQVVDRLGLRDYAIVAHDSGAVIAKLMAAEDARVRGLVLGNTEIPGYHCWQVQLYQRLERMSLGALLFAAGLKLRPVRESNMAFGGCFADLRYIDGEFRRWFLEPMKSRRVIEGHRRLIRSFDWAVVDNLRHTHARISVPVRYIWGAQDPDFPLEKLKPTLGQLAGETTLALIDPGKLFAHEEYPEKFVAEARPFLERVFRSLSAQDRSA